MKRIIVVLALFCQAAFGCVGPGCSGGGSVTSIATGSGLTGGPITTTGTIDLANVSATSHQWIDSVVANVFHKSQPAFTDISGTIGTAQISVNQTRRVCDIIIGDTSGSAITDAQLGPQKRLCYVPAASTVVEVDVAADAGTPQAIAASRHGASASNLLSAALATAASGGIACSNTGGTTGIDGTTTCSATLQNTSMSAGDYIELISGTAGGTAKLMTLHIIYTVN